MLLSMPRGAIAAIALLLTAPAFADGAADVQLARQLGTEGLRLAEAGDCKGAADKLSRAEKLHHAPTTLERLGECQISLGHYVDGSEDLRAVIREQLAPRAPAAFAAAKARAQKALDAALPHIGKLRVDVVGPAPADVTLKVDGETISSASVGLERPIDPGSHAVEASAPSYLSKSANVEVPDGGSQAVTLTLDAEPTPPKKIVVVPVQPVQSTRVIWPAAALFGVAGAGAILTAVFGSLAIARKNDLGNACAGTSCPPTAIGTYNDATTFASVANVGLIVAGVAAAAGIVLLIFAPTKRTEPRVGLLEVKF